MDLYKLLNDSMNEAEKEARLFRRPKIRKPRWGHFRIGGRGYKAPKGQVPMPTRIRSKAIKEFSWNDPSVAKLLEKGNINKIHKKMTKYVEGYARNRGLSEPDIQKVMARMSKSPAVSARLAQRARSKVAQDPKLQARIPRPKISIKGRIRQAALPGAAVGTAGIAYAGMTKSDQETQRRAQLPTYRPEEWRSHYGY